MKTSLSIVVALLFIAAATPVLAAGCCSGCSAPCCCQAEPNSQMSTAPTPICFCGRPPPGAEMPDTATIPDPSPLLALAAPIPTPNHDIFLSQSAATANDYPPASTQTYLLLCTFLC